MFERPWHRTVYKALEALNTRLLRDTCCYFGGGTRIVMELGEYRESLDIDLLCADSAGYRRLRSEISESSLGAILGKPLALAREVRADRYGIRTFFQIDDSKVKFEIVLEGRISLGGEELLILPLFCLDRTSCFAEKLLANADRWADRGVLSRDLIDLAFMRAAWGKIPDKAFVCACRAYGDVVTRSLCSALDLFITHETHRNHCLTSMDIHDEITLQRGIRLLREEHCDVYQIPLGGDKG